MPVRLRHILDRLPLPSLQYYTLMSTSILVGNIFYVHQLVQTSEKNQTATNETIFFSEEKPFSLAYMKSLFSIMISQSLSLLVWEILRKNHVHCILFLDFDQCCLLFIWIIRQISSRISLRRITFG